MKTVVFPGQGSQFRGMGRRLFPKYPQYVGLASNILDYDIVELCLNDPDKNLSNTQFTQPALYVVNALSWFDHQQQSGDADVFMGHSLGEYNALLAAGVFDFETGLKLVKERGRLMGQASGGAMLAVLGVPSQWLRMFLTDHQLGDIDIANYNTASQLVLSATQELIDKAKQCLDEADIQSVALNVSAAFHSRHMRGAAEQFDAFLQSFSFNKPSQAIISNVTARPYPEQGIAELLSKQIESSVRWSESVRYLMAKDREAEFVEMGENPILSNMINSIRRNEQPLQLDESAMSLSTASGVDTLTSDAKEFTVGAADDECSVEQQQPITASSTTANSSLSGGALSLNAQHLGAASFRQRYAIKYAYLTGAMYRAIASKELVVAVGKAGLMGFLGTGGLNLQQIESDITFIQSALSKSQAYGVNLHCNIDDPQLEMDTVELYLQREVRCVEAAAFMMMTPALVYYRVKGLQRNRHGQIECNNKIIAKLSRPEVAKLFMSPPPERMVRKLLNDGKITQEQADMAKQVAMSFDLCVEADSGGHTDQGVASVLLPSIQQLRKQICRQHQYNQAIHIGLSGGIGTPEAAASAFIMGADFILTGSINQCTVEAGISDAVKNMLQEINVQDTEYAPAGDMFELGAKVQVLKRGVFFPARANTLLTLYRQYDALEQIPQATLKQLEEKYFHTSIEQIWAQTQQYLRDKGDVAALEKAQQDPKAKMARVFRWYFDYSSRLAAAGDERFRVNFQVHTGPALGAFNQWVKGTELESWKKRHVDAIAVKLMQETATWLEGRWQHFSHCT